jgi:ribokinase
VDLILRIPRFHDPGETITGNNLVTSYGGKGANQAMAAKRLGGNVTFLTKLGNDPFGRSYRQYLIRNRLNPACLLRDSKLPTGVAVIEVSPRGENRIIVSPGANAALSVRDLKTLSGLWKESRVFVTQLEIPLSTVQAGLAAAGKHGAATVLNPSPAIPLPPETLSLVDFLVPNEGEAERLTGMKMNRREDLPKMAERLLRRGVKNVIITLGPRGLFFKNHGREIWMDAFRVKAVDTTAAGDAFIGALACGIAGGKPIPDILAMANAAGALAVTKLGAQPSLPRRRDLRKLLSL